LGTARVRFHYPLLHNPPDNVRVHGIRVGTFRGVLHSWRLFEEREEDQTPLEPTKEDIRQAREAAMLLVNEVLNGGNLVLIDSLFTKDNYIRLIDWREGMPAHRLSTADEKGYGSTRELLEYLIALRGDTIFQSRLARKGAQMVLTLEPEPTQGWQVDLRLYAPTGRIEDTWACFHGLWESAFFALSEDEEQNDEGRLTQPVPQRDRCLHCGLAIDQTWHFCMHCGSETPSHASS